MFFQNSISSILLSHHNGLENLAASTDSLNSKHLSVHPHLDFRFADDILFQQVGYLKQQIHNSSGADPDQKFDRLTTGG